MATSYGVSQLGILNALMSGKTKSEIYDMVKEKKEKHLKGLINIKPIY